MIKSPTHSTSKRFIEFGKSYKAVPSALVRKVTFSFVLPELYVVTVSFLYARGKFSVRRMSESLTFPDTKEAFVVRYVSTGARVLLIGGSESGILGKEGVGKTGLGKSGSFGNFRSAGKVGRDGKAGRDGSPGIDGVPGTEGAGREGRPGRRIPPGCSALGNPSVRAPTTSRIPEPEPVSRPATSMS